MSYINLIRSVPDRDRMTAEQIHEYLTTPDPKLKQESQATYSTKGLVKEFRQNGEEDSVILVETMVATMRQIGLIEMANSLLTGIDFSDPDIPRLITGLAQANPDTFTESRCKILIDLGIDNRTPTERFGIEDKLTLEEVEKWIQIEQTDTWFNATFEVVRGGLHSGEIVSKADVLAELEGE